MAGNLVEDFDQAFQNCLSCITTQEHFNVTDPDENKTSVEQCVQKLVDVAKQLESFFLQKRLMLSVHKPEQIIREDIAELRLELQRKEMLIQKHNEKLQIWQNILNRQASSQAQSQQQQQQQQQQQLHQQQSPIQSGTMTSTPTHNIGQGQPGIMPSTPTHMGQGQMMTSSHNMVAGLHQNSPPIQAATQMQSQPGMGLGPQSQPGMGLGPQSQPGMGLGPQSQPGMGLGPQSQPGMGLGPQSVSMSMGHMGGQQMAPLQRQASFPQGPLAYLEQTTSNIGMPERR